MRQVSEQKVSFAHDMSDGISRVICPLFGRGRIHGYRHSN